MFQSGALSRTTIETQKDAMSSQYTLLNLPASNEEFAKFEVVTGIPFPEDMKTLYSINNGGKSYNQILSLEFLSLEAITETWQEWRETGRDNDDEKTDGSYPDGAIKPVQANPKWIPLLANGGGNNIGIDLDPGHS